MLLPGTIDSGFSHPSEPVLMYHPHDPALCTAACPLTSSAGTYHFPLHPVPNWARRMAGDLAGRGSAPFSSLQCKQKPKRTKFQSSYSSPGTIAEGGGVGTVTCGGMGGSGMGHGSTWCALRGEGVDPCDNDLAGLDTSICTSIRCIPGPKASLAHSGNSATK